MEITGTAHIVGKEKVKTEKFKFIELVVKTEGDYPQYIPIQFVNTKVDLLNNVNPGSKVTVAINIQGREYNGKYYVSLQGWKIDVTGQGQQAQATAQIAGDDDENDLPW